MTQSSGVSEAFPFNMSAIMEPSLFIPLWPGTHWSPASMQKSLASRAAASLHRCLCRADFYAVLRSTPAYRADMGRPLEMHWISNAARGIVRRLTEFLQHEPNG